MKIYNHDLVMACQLHPVMDSKEKKWSSEVQFQNFKLGDLENNQNS